MQHVVIGTAGHVDHGKSALVRALTGTDPDRLQEEKEREMTIDLGFAFLGDDITFIDVPGHEKFIKNMLSGVVTVDAVVFIVAADDGFMPQSEEHFEILKLMNVERGMVALTKIDTVDPEWVDLVEDDIKQRLTGSFLEDAPIFRVDSISGKGIEEIKQAILKLAEEIPPRPDRGVFRMYVDRVFSIKGSGTVIAGTVLGGELKPGDRAELQPAGITVRIKRIQVHNAEVPKTRIGERAAINLQGVETSQIMRGDLLAQTGYFKSTYMLNVSYNHLLFASKPLANRARIRLHLGTAEYLARAVPLEKKPILPGETGYMQLRLESPTVCEIGDRFVIRDYSPGRTIGGGQILEVHPEKLKYLPDDEIRVLEALDKGGAGDLTEQHIRRSGFVPLTIASVARDISRPEDEVSGLFEKLIEQGKIVQFKTPQTYWVIHHEVLEDSRKLMLKTLDEFHHANPFRLGLKRSELAGKLFGKVDTGLYDAFLDHHVEEGDIELKGLHVLRKGHKIKFNKQQELLAEKILKIYWEAAFVTPEFDELTEQLDAPAEQVRRVIQGLTDKGDLKELSIKIGRALIFHSQRIDEAKDIVAGLFKDKDEIAFFEAREALNSTRKFTTPILNYFDQIGFTVRVGEVRQLKNQS
ncbi:selenocysteine-specific translation elongation factor [candidate division LCP-89 bacterium B3_LCP]|uniref:Selenocysteine-specific elongation factor n=1 Tax=candidate division LCP-89 bacterium B3_LCP TaxID=2012998 RepID=A0A532V0W6_UNCL8|nr:MAG: selenocysteine-specific translation elongation factor [candidate division LCP-89 bacterium B3_LCP]